MTANTLISLLRQTMKFAVFKDSNNLSTFQHVHIIAEDIVRIWQHLNISPILFLHNRLPCNLHHPPTTRNVHQWVVERSAVLIKNPERWYMLSIRYSEQKKSPSVAVV